jgi:CubicO group peptidase (beta-lactamase class C family)
MKTALALAAAAALLGGCVSTYNLTLMPRDSGQLYSGVMENVGGGEGRVSVTIDGKTYDGTWVQVVSDRTTGYALGFGGARGGWGRGWGWGAGGTVTMDNPEGGLATALLQSRDGTGLRCEFRGGSYGTGGGRCRDDRGREYDVQLRAAKA